MKAESRNQKSAGGGKFRVPFLISVFCSLLWAAALPVRGQMTLPILSGSLTFGSNTVSVINVTVVTNVIVTNVFVTNLFYTILVPAPSGIVTPLPGNVIDPFRGSRLHKVITGPTVLSLGAFDPTNSTTVVVQNPSRFPVTWPPTNQVKYLPGGSPPNPTNDWTAVLFEFIGGQFLGSQ